MVKINNNGGNEEYIRRRIYGDSTKSIVHGQSAHRAGEVTSVRAEAKACAETHFDICGYKAGVS